MKKTDIRAAGLEDIELIRTLCFAVWPQTYASILTQEQIDYMLQWMYSAAALQGAMDEGQEFRILYVEGEPEGFSSFGPAGKDTYKLHKLYLLPRLQGSGYGKLLLQEVEKEAGSRGARFLKLNVNRDNPAKHFYEKAGYRVAEVVDVAIGNGYFMNDYVMQKELVP